MCLPHEHLGHKISAKVKIYNLTRAELLFPLCYEIPCTIYLHNTHNLSKYFKHITGFPQESFVRNGIDKYGLALHNLD